MVPRFWVKPVDDVTIFTFADGGMLPRYYFIPREPVLAGLVGL
jgi:hypothetical protein